MVPGAIALQLALIPAILMALAIVREKELGSITNLYVTPVTRLEFLLGKQIPYIVLAFVDFLIMFLMALYIFKVPLKGGFWRSGCWARWSMSPPRPAMAWWSPPSPAPRSPPCSARRS